MSKFVLTAQLRLQAPNNVKAVVNDIQKRLGNVKTTIDVQASAQSIKSVNEIKRATDDASTSVNKLGNAFGVSLKRFAAFSIASRAIGLFSSTLAKAVDDAVSFQNEMVRLSQITGQSLSNLKGLSDQVGDLATSLGVSSKKILSVADILAQAGLQANDLKVAITALTKTDLAPTFGKIEDTAEGAVAILAQFGEGVGALERQLGAINKVSAKFAVESEDLISVVRRTGGVFKASGGTLEELLAVFTSVRATTRESAESIATGLRTIFTRLQRPATIEYLKQFGVELKDLNGRFVGPYKAVQQLSQALSGLEEGDVRFIQIAEELGGYRQIGKVIPLLRQFEVAEKARQAALEGGTSLNEDVVTSQQSLQRQFAKTQESFLRLIRETSETASFQILVKTSLLFANALLKIADAVKPLLPLLAAFAAIKFTQNIGGFFAGVGAGFKKTVGPTGKNAGGKIHAFARGGIVPGTGNRDTVPAMLSPGEFVIRKSSVNKIGAGTLAAMNENKYKDGGEIKIDPGAIGGFFLRPEQGDPRNLPVNTTITVTGGKALQSLGVKPENEDIARQNALLSLNKSQQERLLFGRRGTRAGKKLNKKLTSEKFTKAGTLRSNAVEPNANKALQDEKVKQRIDRNIKQGIVSSGSIDVPLTGSITGYFPGGDDLKKNAKVYRIVKDRTSKGISQAVKEAAGPINKILDAVPAIDFDQKQVNEAARKIAKDPNATATTEGFIYEGIIQGITGAKLAGNQNNFDFPSSSIDSSRAALQALFASTDEGISSLIKADAKRSNTDDAKKSIINKIKNDINKGAMEGVTLTNGGDGPVKMLNGGSSGRGVVKKGQQSNDIGIFDSDMIAGGTNIKKAILEQIKASGKNYEVISGPAGSGKTTFATAKFGKNFVLSDSDIANYARFIILSGASKTKTGDFSEDVQSLLSGASKISVLAPSSERIMKQRQGRIDAAIAGNIPDQRAVGALQGTMKAPIEANEELFKKYKNVEILKEYKEGTKGRGVPASGFFRTPLIDDLLNTPDAVVPRPDIAMKTILASGYGALDVDNTLLKTVGDKAYAKAKTDAERQEVLNRLFRDPQARLNDIKTAKLTQFAVKLIQGIKDGSINPENLSVISKSSRVPGLPEYLNTKFKIPIENMVFTSGKDKGRPLDAIRIKGPRAQRVIKKANGGGISDTVPALLTPGEFVINKSSAQQIGYGNLNRMNKHGVTGFAKGGAVAVQKFVDGGSPKYTFKSGASGETVSQINQIKDAFTRLRAAGLDNADALEMAAADIKNATKQTKAFIDAEKKRIETLKKSTTTQNQSTGDTAAIKTKDKESLLKTAAFIGGLNLATSQLSELAKNADGTSTAFSRLLDTTSVFATTILTVKSGLEQFGVQLPKSFKDVKTIFSTGKGGLGDVLTKGRIGSGATSGGIAKLGLNLAKLAGPLAAVATAGLTVSSVFNGVVSSIFNFKDQLDSAVKAGDVQKAGELAAKQYGVEAANTTRTAGALGGAAAGAVIGSVIPGLGTVVGAIGGAVAGVIAGSLPAWQEGIYTFFGGDSKALVVARAEADALAAKYTKEYAANTKEAEAATRQWEQGLITTEKAMLAWNKSSQTAAEAFAKTQLESAEAQKGKSTGGFAIARNIFTLGGTFGESAGQRNTRIEKEGSTRLLESFDNLNKEFEAAYSGPFAQSLIKAGKSAKEVQQELEKTNPSVKAMKEAANSSDIALKKQADSALNSAKANLEASAKQIENNKKFFEALNLGLYSITERVNATNSAFDTMISAAEGISTFEKSMKVLEASITGQASAMNPKEVQQATSDFANALRQAGASESTIQKNVTSLQSTFQAQASAESALAAASKELQSIQAGGSPEALKGAIEKAVTANISDPTQRADVRNKLSNLELDQTALEKLAIGDTSGVFEAINKRLAQTNEQQINIGKAIVQSQQNLNKAIQLRIDAENKSAEAANKAIDMQLEAAQAIEEFGGIKVTPQQKRAATTQKAANALRGAGVNIGAGGTQDFLRAQRDIQSELASIARRRTAGTFTNTDATREKQLLEAGDTLLSTQRERIAQAKEDLELAKKKNALEKSAFEKLLGGDVMGAFEDMASSAASKLLEIGDASLARALGPKALAGGLKNLEETGATDIQKRKAAQIAASSIGLPTSIANAFAGTTPEERAAKERAVQEARAFSAMSNVAVQSAQAQAEQYRQIEQQQRQNMASAQTGANVNFTTGGVARTAPGAIAAPAQIRQQGITGAPGAGGATTTTGAQQGVSIGISPQTVTSFNSSVESFSAAVDKLQNIKLSVQLDPTNINVNLNGGTFLNNLSKELRNSVLDIVAQEIPKYKIGNDGKLGKGGLVG